MLTPEQWEEIGKQAENLYKQLELEIIEEIAERITNVGYANTVVINDIKIAEEMGILYQDIISTVAKHNNTTERKIKEIFEEAGIKTIEYDDQIYKKAGIKTREIKQSKSMLQLLEATARKTNNNLSNLVMTTAETSQTTFYKAMNKAYMEVSTGVKSYTQSIIDTIKEISKQGTYITYPSGRKLSLESAVRMNIVTGINQACGKLQLIRAEELEWDLMELTAHIGARPEHTVWQGKIVSRSGKEGYLSLRDIGYGEAKGFKGVNCRHDWRPYYEGSTRTYTDKELKEMAEKTVTYKGKEIPYYKATQIQREMERQIRQDKKDIAGLQGSLLSNSKDIDIKKIKEELRQAKTVMQTHNTTLNEFLRQTGFRKDSSRLTVGVNKKIEEKITLDYKDITKEILHNKNKKYKVKEQQYFIDENNNRYNVDGKNVIMKPTEKEKEVANILGKIYGGEVRIIPRINNPLNIKTPDYIINNEKFDLKEITGKGKYVIQGNIKGKEKQANNFIIDITNTELKIKEAKEQIHNIYNSKHYMWLDKIFLIKNKDILNVYKRNN